MSATEIRTEISDSRYREQSWIVAVMVHSAHQSHSESSEPACLAIIIWVSILRSVNMLLEQILP